MGDAGGHFADRRQPIGARHLLAQRKGLADVANHRDDAQLMAASVEQQAAAGHHMEGLMRQGVVELDVAMFAAAAQGIDEHARKMGIGAKQRQIGLADDVAALALKQLAAGGVDVRHLVRRIDGDHRVRQAVENIVVHRAGFEQVARQDVDGVDDLADFALDRRDLLAQIDSQAKQALLDLGHAAGELRNDEDHHRQRQDDADQGHRMNGEAHRAGLLIDRIDEFVGPDVADHAPAFADRQHGVHDVAAHLTAADRHRLAAAHHLPARMLGRNGHPHRIVVLRTRTVSDDGIEAKMKIADANLGKGGGDLIGITAQATVEESDLRLAVAAPSVIGKQPLVAPAIPQMLREQHGHPLQLHFLFADDGFVSAQLEGIAGGDDRQTDDRQQNQHQLHAQGGRPEAAKKAQHASLDS